MRLTIHKIRYKNFLSTGNIWTEIVLDQYNTTLIVGKNGSGKSTILDAISFALFNKPFRNINKPKLVNSITQKDCVVEIEFTINGHDFKVIRGVSPIIFEIWKSGELINPPADNRDYQKAFETYILRVNHKTFCQVVALGSAIFTPFSSLVAKDKRNVIEDLLNLIIFSRMNLFLKSDISDLEKVLSKDKNDKRLLEQEVELVTKHYEEMLQNFDDTIAVKRKVIENHQANITKNEPILAKKTAQINDLTARKQIVDLKEHRDTSSLLNKLELSINQTQKMSDFFTQNCDCPTCNQIIDEEFKKFKIEENNKKIADFNRGVTLTKRKLAQIEKKLEYNRKLDDSIHFLDRGAFDVKKEISFLQGSIRLLEEDIKELEEKKNAKESSVNLDELNQKLIALDALVMGKQEDLGVMEYAATLLKDSGIKSQFLKVYIPVINQKMAKYLQLLDFQASYELNEDFEATIKSRYRDDFAYESFSQGEKANIDLALLFTWREIAAMRGSLNCNILIFDEIMDGPTDIDNLENMLKLIKSLTGDTNVIIISHKTDGIEDKFDQIIEFEKIKNFSRIKQ